MKRNLELELLSPWHAGTGRGDGPAADAVVLRTRGGLPYLPGRTVKGLLRDGVRHAEGLGRVPAGTTMRLFGERLALEGETPDRADRRSSRDTAMGCLSFSDARLPASYEAYALGGEQPEAAAWARSFFDVHAATALEHGVAKTKTLRTFEVAVPMTLTAEIEGPDDGGWEAALEVACGLIRAVGAHRNRGFGRAALRLVREDRRG